MPNHFRTILLVAAIASLALSSCDSVRKSTEKPAATASQIEPVIEAVKSKPTVPTKSASEQKSVAESKSVPVAKATTHPGDTAKRLGLRPIEVRFIRQNGATLRTVSGKYRSLDDSNKTVEETKTVTEVSTTFVAYGDEDVTASFSGYTFDASAQKPQCWIEDSAGLVYRMVRKPDDSRMKDFRDGGVYEFFLYFEDLPDLKKKYELYLTNDPWTVTPRLGGQSKRLSDGYWKTPLTFANRD